MKSVMRISKYECWVSLGCSKEEQSFKQPVYFDLSINMNHSLKGMVSDQLIDAIDYVVLTDLIKAQAEKKSYQLIEHMCFEVHQSLLTYLKNSHCLNGAIQLQTQVQKLRAPVPHLQGGVFFTCEDQFEC